MSKVKLHNVSQLGLPSQQGNNNSQKVPRLGIATNQLDYEDSFKPIDSKYVKLLIERLSVSHFINNTFDAANYIDSNSFIKNQTQKDLLAALSPKKDAISIAKERIPQKTKKTKEQLEQELEESYYFLLSKSLSLNTTVAFIDNEFTKNGHNLNIDYKNKIISYCYLIYYKVSDELIVRENNEIKTSKSNYAIILNSGAAETLFFFVEKVYLKKRPNSVDIMRESIYNKYLAELNKTTDIGTLVFLYDNLPNYIKLGYDNVEQIDKKPYKLPDNLLWKHLEIFVNYDKWSDASYYVLLVMSMISPKFLMQKFLKDQSLVVTIYNGLDDQSPINEFFGLYPYSKTFDIGNSTFEPTNKDSFVSLLNGYIQLFENDPQVAVFESSGAHFHQGTKKGGKYDPEVIYRLDSNLVFSDDKKNKVLLTNYWESKQYLGQFFNQQGGVSEEYEYDRGNNESGYYNPLDVVKFTQYDDKGEAITLNVPAIFVKHASDVKEWEKVNEGIRLGVNVIVIIASVATIYSGVSSVFLTAAIADIGLASADIIIQSEKDNLKRTDKGKEFLESWEKIYVVAGVVTFSPVAIKAVAIYAPKIVSSGAELLQVSSKMITNPEVYKKVKDLTTKAIHSLEISNFNKTGLEILKKGFKEFASLKNAKKLQDLGVIFVKGAEDTVAVIYKGAVIAYGKAKIVTLQLKTALDKLRGIPLEKYLDELVELAGMAENIKTIKNVDLFLASAERLASLNITAKTALKYLDEALPHFNHKVIDGSVVQIAEYNCTSVVQVVEEFLRTGIINKSKYVSELQGTDITILTGKYGGKFEATTLPNLEKLLNEGERGIIYGITRREKFVEVSGEIATKTDGHVFNFIKKDGVVVYKDGQIGRDALFPFKHYIEFKYLKTN